MSINPLSRQMARPACPFSGKIILSSEFGVKKIDEEAVF